MSSMPPLPLLRLLCWPPVDAGVRAALAASPAGPFEFVDAADAADATQRLMQGDVDLAWVSLDLRPGPSEWRVTAEELAVVAQVDDPSDPSRLADALAAVEHGVQDLLPTHAPAWELGLRLRAAVVRHRLGRAARTAYATDLATGLPHQQQLLEHMSHLLALREREPAPMALLVLRIEGLATTEARMGASAASALRRKLAVRLRSGLRASDVVASIGRDSFAVLLAWIDAAADVDGVAAKLVRAVQRPFSVGGQSAALAVSVGMRRYPEDGKDAQALLQGAVAQAAGQAGQGRAGFANHLEGGPATAANDDEA